MRGGGGFRNIDPEVHRERARAGGLAAQASGNAHRFTVEEARAAGRKGGAVVSADRKHMAEVGRLGGIAVSENREHMARIGRKGGKAVSKDRKHMAAIGAMNAAPSHCEQSWLCTSCRPCSCRCKQCAKMSMTDERRP